MSYGVKEDGAKLFLFGLADAEDFTEFLVIGGASGRHVNEGLVGEDGIGRDAACIRAFFQREVKDSFAIAPTGGRLRWYRHRRAGESNHLR